MSGVRPGIFQLEPNQQERDLRLLSESLESLLRARDRILRTASWRLSLPGCAGWGGLYVGGGRIPLGMLLTLWEEGSWVVTCPVCQENELHIVSVSGSPLSGSYQATGICRACRRAVSAEDAIRRIGTTEGNNFGRFYVAVRRHRGEFANPTVSQPKQPPPNWRWSVDPERPAEPAPDRNQFASASFDQVISELSD